MALGIASPVTREIAGEGWHRGRGGRQGGAGEGRQRFKRGQGVRCVLAGATRDKSRCTLKGYQSKLTEKGAERGLILPPSPWCAFAGATGDKTK